MSELAGITERLAENHVAFVVVGGLAGVLQGSSLMTRDVDVVCDMSAETLQRVWQALSGLNPVHRMTSARMEFTLEQARRGGFTNLYLSTDLGKLALLGEIKGIGSFAECLSNSEPFSVRDSEVRVLSIDALIAAKRAMGRPRDHHAVVDLEAIRDLRNQQQ